MRCVGWMVLAACWIGLAACGNKGDVPPDVPMPDAREFGADGMVLAVMVPLEATGLPGELVGFERGFSDLVATQLREIGVVAPGIEEPAEVAIAGQMFLMGNQLRIDTRVARMPPADPEVLGVASASGPVEAFPEHLSKVVRTLAKVLGLEAPRQPAPTESVEAVVALGRALVAVEEGDDAAALRYLETALAADAELARAQELQALISPR